MYRWYQEASECYAFLCDVHSQDLKATKSQNEFSSSVWFTRGWTLQELLAPKEVIFYNSKWEEIGCKSGIDCLLQKITTIEADVLCGKTSLADCSIAQKMSWQHAEPQPGWRTVLTVYLAYSMSICLCYMVKVRAPFEGFKKRL